VFDPQQIEEAYARPRRGGGNLPTMRLEASSILAKAHQGIDAVAERKAEAAARLKSLGQLIDPYLLVRATGDASWRKMRPKSASSTTRYLNKSWAPLHGCRSSKSRASNSRPGAMKS